MKFHSNHYDRDIHISHKVFSFCLRVGSYKPWSGSFWCERASGFPEWPTVHHLTRKKSEGTSCVFCPKSDLRPCDIAPISGRDHETLVFWWNYLDTGLRHVGSWRPRSLSEMMWKSAFKRKTLQRIKMYE